MLLHALDNTSKHICVVFCKSGECFAVYRNVVLFESVDKARVGETEWAYGGVDAKSEEAAELTLLGTAVAKRVYTCLFDSNLRDALLALAIKAVALHLLQDVAAVLRLHCSSFDACHRGEIRE